MNQSESIAELAAALAAAQSEIKGAVKDAENPFFKSSYADLASVWDACRGPLTKNGLCVIQTSEAHDGRTLIVTTLAHKSGQWIRGYMPVVAMKPDPQSLGSAITYARRYSLAAICSVPQIDDDAESAMTRQPAQQQAQRPAPQPQAARPVAARAPANGLQKWTPPNG